MRSDPLILDKETDEPRELAWVQTVWDPWRLIVSYEFRNKGKLFKSYRKAKKAGAKIQKEHPEYEVTIVSRQVGYGPPRSKVSDQVLLRMNFDGLLWCPYCRKFREFLYDPLWEKKRCPVCRISTSDHSVQVNNPGMPGREW